MMSEVARIKHDVWPLNPHETPHLVMNLPRGNRIEIRMLRKATQDEWPCIELVFAAAKLALLREETRKLIVGEE